MNQRTQEPGNNNDVAIFILVPLAAFLLGWLIWRSFHVQIVTLVIYMRIAFMQIAGIFVESAQYYEALLRQTNPADMTFTRFLAMSNTTGSLVRWPVIALILGVGMAIYMSAVSFKKKHSMQSLIEQEVKLWPEISPVVKLDLVNMDPFTGGWAVSMNEREFATKYKLIEPNGALRKEKAEAVFARQLGPKWRGTHNLKPHEKAFFAACCIRIEGDKQEAIDRLRDLAVSYANNPEAMDYSWVDAAIDKHASGPLIQRAIGRHAYVRTLLCTLVQLSRLEGVFASSLWIWLKPVDRELFYALNCVGRYADFVEVAGIMSHWRAEKKLALPVSAPYVSPAVSGLEEALNDFCDDDRLNRIFK